MKPSSAKGYGRAKPASAKVIARKEEKYKIITYHVDANNKILGRLATHIAVLLMGKNQANFSPSMEKGNNVIVKNADKIKLSGKKLTKKLYYHHTGHPGGLRSEKMQDIFIKKPSELIKKAVLRMLPKNKLQNIRIKRLKFE